MLASSQEVTVEAHAESSVPRPSSEAVNKIEN